MWILQLSFLGFILIHYIQLSSLIDSGVKSTVDFIKTKLETSMMEFYQERFCLLKE